MKQARDKSLRFPSAKDVSHQLQRGAKNSTRVSTQCHLSVTPLECSKIQTESSAENQPDSPEVTMW